jgi:hypothetical protein
MALIQSMGLYWNREDVFWGRQKVPGTLLGINISAKKSEPVDFREQTGIYVLYADYDPVYVGQTGGKENQRLFIRLKQHTTDDLAGRWNKFSWFGVNGVIGDGTLQKDLTAFQRTDIDEGLNHLEGILINVLEPQLNSQGGKFGGSVTRYLQYRDQNLGPDRDEMLKTIYDYMQTH